MSLMWYLNSYLQLPDPPGPPEIDGYNENKIIKTGDTMKLLCISRGGNPLAQVSFKQLH